MINYSNSCDIDLVTNEYHASDPTSYVLKLLIALLISDYCDQIFCQLLLDWKRLNQQICGVNEENLG